MAIAESVKRYKKEIVGFSLFLAWEYCALFGCALVTTSPVHNGIEYVWLISGGTEALAAIAFAGCAKLRKIPRFRMLCIASGTTLALAAVCLRLAFAAGEWNTYLVFGVAGGVLAGIGSACGLVVWGTALKRRGEEGIELTVASSFFASFAVYCLIIFLKNCTVNCVLLCLFASASMGIALSMSGNHTPDAATGDAPHRSFRIIPGKSPALNVGKVGEFPLRGLLSVALLVAVLWAQIAFFRVLETPDYPSNRFMHYLVPFSVSCLIALALIAVALRNSRYLNMTLMFRWQLPFLLVSCGILYAAPLDQATRSIAYTFDFLGMFGLQFGFWVGAAKQARRVKGNSTPLFASLLFGKGVGIASGSAVSLWLSVNMSLDATTSYSILLCAAVLMVSMTIGFNPKWLAGKAAEDELAEKAEAQPDANARLDSLFNTQAHFLQHEFGLTKRETEIAAMLLAGRSRPYIRDELVISLNTVHTHAKNILAKCGVHSQQELMDLARSHAA